MLKFFLPVGLLSPALSRDHLSRFAGTVAESCYGAGSHHSARDPYRKQRVQYYKWKLQRKYERTIGYKVWGTAYDLLVYYTQFWQVMYVIRALSMTFALLTRNPYY